MTKKLFITILFSTITLITHAQLVHLLKDINTTTGPTTFSSTFAVTNDVLYYGADNNNGHGKELWRTDGTPAGTYMVKDIMAGEESSYPDQIVATNGSILFMAKLGAFGEGPFLYGSNGTSNGTFEFPGKIVPYSITVFNNLFYFLKAGVGNTVELWRSDATIAGTIRLFQSDIDMYAVEKLIVAGNYLYFSTTSNSNVQQLWRSDGTGQGTFALKSDSYGVFSPAVVGNKLFFWAYTPTEGYALWSTDGSMGQTAQVKDLQPGYAGGYSLQYTSSETHLYFGINIDGNDQFWKSDGTDAGTVLVDSNPDVFGSYKYANGKVFLRAESLKVSDGNSEFQVISDPNLNIANWGAYLPVSFGGKVYFSVETYDALGMEPWVSDGTSAGTHRMSDFYLGEEGSNATPVAVLQDKLIWVAKDRLYSNELRVLSSSGTNLDLVVDMNKSTASSQPYSIFPTSEATFITANDGMHGIEMWIHDQNTNETTLTDIYSGLGSSIPEQYIQLGDYLMFSCYDSLNANQFWSRRFSTGEIQRLTSSITINPGFSPQHPTYCNNRINISSGIVPHGAIYATDGTIANTNLVVDELDVSLHSFVCYEDNLYFTSGNSNLYKCDGTAAGTSIVKNFNLGVNSGILYNNLTLFAGKMFFTATDLEHGLELWVSDGTTENTQIFADLISGTGSSAPQNLTVVGDKLFFTTINSNYKPELWVTDGTQSGTQVLTILTSPQTESSDLSLIGGDHLLYFSRGILGGNSMELWRSDGTNTGTFQLESFNTSLHTFNTTMFVWSDWLYFQGSSPENGVELWVSDGTVENTALLEDICPGPCSSSPNIFAVMDSTIYLSAFRTDIGVEPWMVHAGLTKKDELPDFAENQIQVWGNPISDNQLAIRVNMSSESEITFRLWSVTAQQVWSASQQLDDTSQFFLFTIPNVPNGAYYLEAIGKQHRAIEKVMILH